MEEVFRIDGLAFGDDPMLHENVPAFGQRHPDVCDWVVAGKRVDWLSESSAAVTVTYVIGEPFDDAPPPDRPPRPAWRDPLPSEEAAYALH